MLTSSFPDRELIAELTAKMLLEIGAVHFRTDKPFMFTSGLASPVYIDCRKLISYPRIRNTLMDFTAGIVIRDIGFEKIDSVTGGETAGIPFAAWLADKLSLPMHYVRKKPKGFGRDAQIEGNSIEGKQVLLVEDLTTDGGSKIKFCEAIRKAGAEITDTVVVFYYDIFPQSRQNLKDIGLNLHYLATWRDVLAVCKKQNYFDPETLKQVESFLDDPLAWSGANGGATEISALYKKD
ncbi:orotate phosphoribosyltransferase [Ahrensia sp. 13_GOM-1096m]|uniref:orotate phosphoribosyltransferase n=1 Tax=Ahrensia sp. 13_GOM-1096m TaxID=1380380 RepID=UPI0004797F19|nr:orotate phosphoribosyltransferase [Ahrensia sp. 13_GOM-1096m]